MRLIADETWAALTIWMEARGEPREGRVAIGEVIRDRVARRYQSDGTVIGAILRAYQFSGWNTSDPNRRLAAALEDTDADYLDCLAAWRTALAGSSFAKGAVLYYAPDSVVTPPPWAGACHVVARIGKHVFYATGSD
jgi:spore germination cell wall hydrolase CwlJ-like protein